MSSRVIDKFYDVIYTSNDDIWRNVTKLCLFSFHNIKWFVIYLTENEPVIFFVTHPVYVRILLQICNSVCS